MISVLYQLSLSILFNSVWAKSFGRALDIRCVLEVAHHVQYLLSLYVDYNYIPKSLENYVIIRIGAILL